MDPFVMEAEEPQTWTDCEPKCSECPHCDGCGGSAVRGGPYGCTCDELDDDEPGSDCDERCGYGQWCDD